MRSFPFRWPRTALAAAWLFLPPVAVHAQGPSDAAAPRPVAGATAMAPEHGPKIDGDVLQDDAWKSVEPLTNFRQTTPIDGAPVSEKTEVRIGYTNDALVIGVVCYDTDPSKIVVSDSRRDSSLDDVDSFQFVIDSYKDGQNGFVFGTSPAGGEYDGQVALEGREGDRAARQQAGAGGGFNLNWDAVWQVRTKTGDFGWSAEFSIPFKTLRYAKGGDQNWGLNMQRNIRRKKEVAYWSPLPRQYNLFRVSRAGTLGGVKAPSQRNLKITPYVLGQTTRDYRTEKDFDRSADIGADLKYSVTPSLTLDLTLNTDFAQVEVDEQQINLDRFTLFFPEKRPFFLENAGLFTAGNSGEVDLFFSRRIGIASDGTPIPILGGARLSGRVAGWNVGLIDMQTRAVKGTAPSNNFGIVRFSRELKNRSGLGVLFVNREKTSEENVPRVNAVAEHNRTFAADGRWGLGQYTQLTAYAAGTATPGIKKNARAWDVGFVRESPRFDLRLKYSDIGEGFNPEVGFLRRTAFRKLDTMIFNRTRPGKFGLQEIRPHISFRGYWKPPGFLSDRTGSFWETGFLHFDNHWEFKSQWEIHTGLNLTHEGIFNSRGFEIAPAIFVPRGEYDHKELQIVVMSPQSKAVSLNMQTFFGGYYGGKRRAANPTIRFRAGEKVSGSLAINFNDISLPQGDFQANLYRLRASYSFSPQVFVQSLVQFNQQQKIWSGNFRVGWLQTSNTGLFIVYNEGRDTRGDGLGLVRDRSFVIKYSRLVDVLK